MRAQCRIRRNVEETLKKHWRKCCECKLCANNTCEKRENQTRKMWHDKDAFFRASQICLLPRILLFYINDTINCQRHKEMWKRLWCVRLRTTKCAMFYDAQYECGVLQRKDAHIKKFQYQRERTQSRERDQHQEKKTPTSRETKITSRNIDTNTEKENTKNESAKAERDNTNTETDDTNTERNDTTVRDTETNSKRDRHKHQARQRQTPRERHTNTNKTDWEYRHTHQERYTQTPRLLHLWSWTFSCELLTRRNCRCGSNQRWSNRRSHTSSRIPSVLPGNIFVSNFDYLKDMTEPEMQKYLLSIYGLRSRNFRWFLIGMGVDLSWCHKCSLTRISFKYFGERFKTV